MVALFVILTIVCFLLADSVVQWREARRRALAPAAAARAPRAFTLDGIALPSGVFVAPGHTWMALNASGSARVGVDDFARKALGRLDQVQLPRIGQQVRAGEPLFALRQGDRVATLTAPVDGVVASVNEHLAADAGALEGEPYGCGWVCALRPINLAKGLKPLTIAEEARTWIAKEFERFQAMLTATPVATASVGPVLADGGQPTEGVLALMDAASWQRFERDFLRAEVEAPR